MKEHSLMRPREPAWPDSAEGSFRHSYAFHGPDPRLAAGHPELDEATSDSVSNYLVSSSPFQLENQLKPFAFYFQIINWTTIIIK